jgi:hypothetical protein
VNALPSKQELLAFQARWMRPAGVCAILGALVIAASLPVQPSTGGDNDAERLTKFHEQSTKLIVGQGVMIGIAILLFIPLLYVLIRAAAGRTERIRRAMISLAFVGPILFSISGLIVAGGLSDVASKFVDQAPAKERQARQQATAAQAQAAKAPPAQQGKAVKGQPATTAATTTGTSTTQSTTTTPPATATPLTPEQAAIKGRDDLASNLIDDSSLLQVGSLVRFVGLITLVFALIYIPLWAMRTGLLTRFWAMLGLALGVSLILVPIGIFGLVLWFGIVGLMLAGWWPTPLPPAWAAGEAIPWPGREDIGQPPEDRSAPGTVEGSGREVSEQALAENGAGRDDGEPAQRPESQGQRRKKRKRRG